ncbi:stage II sporulation protein M [Halalkalibacter sp. APA_J-10(15)]|uniref:stage II sporulation protein M n=1 Tax=Halalkalibacter sp. APA_J-10(15) TaxID=2933805 RepID=UPI001FF67250|nr:stage II sporulation protein M [Halalkalibacter sp. APA_J-10(15)]MCK0469934.1 stage II sporulation protein M [Halalkalibacter sp. APA_J-10(15)]
MNIKQFTQQHREEWNNLEQLISTLQKNNRSRTGSQHIHDFHRTYQKVAQHLSYSQTNFPSADVTFYLNGLVAKAHNLLYRDQLSSWKQIKYFFSTKFVHLLFDQWKFVLVAMLLFTLGAIGSFFAVMQDELSLYTVLPAELAKAFDPTQVGAAEGTVNAPVMSAEIMVNNIQVAILAFAGGITFGLLTVYILIYNGIIIGAIAALFWHYGNSYEFWAYIVPHGIVELTAIFIAGGAGLLMGYRLFAPGDYSRAYQLKENAKRSVQLLLGTIPLFVIAGVIEGYITPAGISLEAKYAIALITTVGLILYALIGKALILKREQSNQS